MKKHIKKEDHSKDRDRKPEPKSKIQQPAQEEKPKKVWNPSALYF